MHQIYQELKKIYIYAEITSFASFHYILLECSTQVSAYSD